MYLFDNFEKIIKDKFKKDISSRILTEINLFWGLLFIVSHIFSVNLFYFILAKWLNNNQYEEIILGLITIAFIVLLYYYILKRLLKMTMMVFLLIGLFIMLFGTITLNNLIFLTVLLSISNTFYSEAIIKSIIRKNVNLDMYRINRHKFYVNIIYAVYIVIMIIQEYIAKPYFTSASLFNISIRDNILQNYISVTFDRLIIIIVLGLISLAPSVRNLIVEAKNNFEKYINGFIIIEKCTHTSENREVIELDSNSNKFPLQEMEEKKDE